MGAQTFDSLDRKILAELDVHGRISVSDLARAVRHGRDIVAYRVQRLEADGILRGAEPVLDPGALGLGLYKTYVSFAQADRALKRVHSRVRAHPQVYCTAHAQGRWDLVFNTAAISPLQYGEIRTELLGSESGAVRELGFATFLRMTYFHRKYLGSRARSWTTMTAPGRIELDAVDRRILAAVTKDARRSDAELAAEAQVTPIVVRYRMAKLERSRVILGYRARFDRSAFGLFAFKVHIALHDFSEQTTRQLEQFARGHQYVSQFMLQLGTWSCEINVEAHDTGHLGEIVNDLRAALVDRIGLVEVTMYDRDEFTWGFGEKRGASDAPPVTVANAA